MFSVVIIARNESRNIETCINSARNITNDVVVVDSGSSDDTVSLARKAGARVFEYGWHGYGANKNFGNQQAISDWIISIDGDELMSDQLIHTLQELTPQMGTVYQLNSMVNYAGTWIKHSGWYPRWKHRVFNKNECCWNNAPVHEDLIPLYNKKIVKLKGDLLHYSYSSINEHKNKIQAYAILKAEKWLTNKTPPSLAKRYFGSIFNFTKTYILKFGFLDGQAGWSIAMMDAHMAKEEVKAYDSMTQSKSI